MTGRVRVCSPTIRRSPRIARRARIRRPVPLSPLCDEDKGRPGHARPCGRGPFPTLFRLRGREGERVEILHAAGEAFLIIFTWHTLPFLFLGVTMGLCLGILPGIGGRRGNRAAAALHLCDGRAHRDGPAARAGGDHHHGRSDFGDRVGRARPCGLGGDHARRLSDDAARRGGPRARRLLYVRHDGRLVRRRGDGRSAARGAALHSLCRLARAAVARRVRHFHGGGAVGQHASCAA